MTTTPMPPVLPPEDPDDATAGADSVEADRRASHGKDPEPAETDPAAVGGESSAAADYAASMGELPETD